ncbi:MAG: hypothetical protein ACOYL6_01220 [Bacteriovoracaceae bacterium]
MKKLIILSLVLTVSLPVLADNSYKFEVADEVGDTKRNSLEETSTGRDVASSEDFYIDPDDMELQRNPAALKKEKARIRTNLAIKSDEGKRHVQEWRAERTFPQNK